MKYYAIGGEYCPGIFKDLKLYQEYTTGHGAIPAKSFKTIPEAIEFIEKKNGKIDKCYLISSGQRQGVYIKKDCFTKYAPNAKTEKFAFSSLKEAMDHWEGRTVLAASPEEQETACAIASTDGSFKGADGKYKYGGVLYYKGKAYIIKGHGSEDAFLAMGAHAGEIAAAQSAIEMAIKLGAESIIVEYDREAVQNWAVNPPVKNAPVERKKYFSEMQKLKEEIKISFSKVRAHSGDPRNEIADRLAKTALADVAVQNPFSEREEIISIINNEGRKAKDPLAIIDETILPISVPQNNCCAHETVLQPTNSHGREYSVKIGKEDVEEFLKAKNKNKKKRKVIVNEKQVIFHIGKLIRIEKKITKSVHFIP